MDRRPLVLTVRARRAIFVAGELVPVGEISVMLTDDAIQAAAAGRVEVVGEHSARVRFSPAAVWSAAATSPESRQPGGWMTPPGSELSPPPRAASPMELVAERRR